MAGPGFGPGKTVVDGFTGISNAYLDLPLYPVLPAFSGPRVPPVLLSLRRLRMIRCEHGPLGSLSQRVIHLYCTLWPAWATTVAAVSVR